MQFSDTTTNQGIIQEITFLTGASTTDYPMKDRTRHCNLGLNKVVALILKSDQKWEWDDSNNTDLPIGTTSLVANQKDYGITGATYLKITKVICKDSGGTWHTLKPMDKNSPEAEDLNEQTNPGTPTHYDLIGNSIFLGPYPNYASAGGLRIFFQRNVHPFVINADDTGDTTAEPGFAQPFHELIPLYASRRYLMSKGLIGDRLREIKEEIKELETALLEFYSTRNAEDQPRLRFRRNWYGENGGGKTEPDNVVS